MQTSERDIQLSDLGLNRFSHLKSMYNTLPVGTYNCILEEAVIKPSSDGRGRTLLINWSVKDGVYKGRKIYSSFMVDNEKSQYVVALMLMSMGFDTDPPPPLEELKGAECRVVLDYGANSMRVVESYLPPMHSISEEMMH
jgi:hypothetical protein